MSLWGEIKNAGGAVLGAAGDAVKNVLGQVSATATIGYGQPAGATIRVGEDRVMSRAALLLVLVVGLLVGIIFMKARGK